MNPEKDQPTQAEVIVPHPKPIESPTIVHTSTNTPHPTLSHHDSDAPRSPVAEIDLIGSLVAGYEILSELGRGGMGVVYKARQSELGRTVALKMVLAGAYAGSTERERFHTEAEAIAAVTHPNIVQVYEVGNHQGLPFIALEYVDGGTLSDKIAAGLPSGRETARLVEQLARGLNAAHQAGVVHRDLKPSNVLMTHDGTPKVTDFGLAKRIEGGSGLTQSGAILGTPAYMAPEQAAGEGKRIGPAADVYALGAILYECLTGRPPFDASTPIETILQVLRSEPVPPRQLNPKAPRDLETICLKCLNKEIANRYASADGLAEDLRRWQADVPIRARPAGRTERTIRWCRRNPMAAVAVVLVALLLITSIGLAVRESENALALADEQYRTKLALMESRERLWESYRTSAQARRSSRLMGHRFESLQVLTSAANMRPDSRLRDEAIACLALPDLRPSQSPFTPSPTPHRQANPTRTATAPTTGYTATVDANGTTVVVRDRLGKVLHSFPHSTTVENLHWRYDGKYLATATSGPVTIWAIPEGRRQSVLEGHQNLAISLDFTRNSGMLLTNSYDGTARFWDIMDGREIFRCSEWGFYGPFGAGDRQIHNGGSTQDFADGRECRVLHHETVGRGGDRPPGYIPGAWDCNFSPDGRLLVTGGMASALIWDVQTGQLLARLPSSTGGVAFLPDGSVWVAVNGGISVWPIRREMGEGDNRIFGPPEVLKLPGAFVGSRTSAFTVSRDGSTLVAIDPSQNCAWVLRIDRSAPPKRLDQPICFSAAVSPDGGLIATSSWSWQPVHPIAIYDSKTSVRTQTIVRNPYARSVFSPDGKVLATGSQTDFTFWDVATWRPLRTIGWNSHLPGRLDFSPDGRLFAMTSTNYLVRLVNPANGETVATLTPPEPSLISCIRFSPTGSHIAVLSEVGRVYLWDIRRIREQLRSMKLDWDDPLPTPPESTVPLRVRIIKDAP